MAIPVNPAIIIRVVAVEKIIDLRHRILRPGLPIETARFGGDESPTAIHLAAFNAGDETIVLGCATLHLNTYEARSAYQLRGMAVDPQQRHRGIGRSLVASMAWRAGLKGIQILWANCRTSAVPFYLKLGWKIVSDEFVIPTAGPHFRMTLDIPITGENAAQT